MGNENSMNDTPFRSYIWHDLCQGCNLGRRPTQKHHEREKSVTGSLQMPSGRDWASWKSRSSKKRSRKWHHFGSRSPDTEDMALWIRGQLITPSWVPQRDKGPYCFRGQEHGAWGMLLRVSRSKPGLSLGEAAPQLSGLLFWYTLRMASVHHSEGLASLVYPVRTCGAAQGPWRIASPYKSQG